MQRLKREVTRLNRGVRYSMVLAQALFQAEQRRFVREALTFARSLPGRLDRPLPAALEAMTPLPATQKVDSDSIREIVDALTAFGAGRPLGICLRRSLTRYHFLRRAGVPVVVRFGARRLDAGIGGHAWLTLDGEPYHEQPQHYLDYAVMFSYPADAASVSPQMPEPTSPDGSAIAESRPAAGARPNSPSTA